MNSKTIIGGLVAGVAFFLMGWLVYGILLKDYMATHTFQRDFQKKPEEFIWWALILSNFVWGFLLSMVFGWSNTSGFGQGMMRGLMFGLFTALAYDLSFYATSNMYLGNGALAADVIAIGVMVGIAGGIVGVINASGKKPATTA